MVTAMTSPTGARKDAADSFPMLTAMLVMPFPVFKAQGRIMKSTKRWRGEAFEKKWLVEYDESLGKVVIFISHTWWDRKFTDETNDPNDPYDCGAPDYQSDYPDEEREVTSAYNWSYGVRDEGGDIRKEKRTYPRPKDLKHRVICAGVQRLCEEKGLKEEDVALWIDWQSIYQDDKEMKLKGVMSLIRYATMCPYMLVPTEEESPTEEKNSYIPGNDPSYIPAYGSRGWCRVEYFIFALLAEMSGKLAETSKNERYTGLYVKGGYVKGTGVQLYAIYRDGQLLQYPAVKFPEMKEKLPSLGALANLNDASLVKKIEDQMIDAYANTLVEDLCGKVESTRGASQEQAMVMLDHKFLRPQHVGPLMAAVERHQVAKLNLHNNDLGPEGGAKLAEALKTNTTLTQLILLGNEFDNSTEQAIRVAWGDRGGRLRLGDRGGRLKV